MLRITVPGGAAALAALLASHPGFAQNAAPATITLAPVTVEASPAGSLTVPDVEQQRDALDETVGAVGFVDSESYKGRFANNLHDVLADAPGVLAQPRYGQELRLSIRGSGIARSYHLRGLEILQDGIPVNLADGSGDFYQIDPLGLRSVEIYKGGNGLAYGSSALGGAINFVTPTAYTAIAPNVLRAEGSSFGTARLSGQASRVLGDFDLLGTGTLTHIDGYRQHERTNAAVFNGNAGYRIAPDLETRFYVGSYVVMQQLPGTLSLADALANPRAASSSALAGNQQRNSWTERIANRTSQRLASGRLDIDSWAIHKTLFHPIFQVLDQDGWTYGLAPRYTAALTIGGLRDDLILGGRVIGGRNRALQFVNVGGSRGAQTLDSRQNAEHYDAYVENRLFILPDVALMTGAKLFYDRRSYVDERQPANNADREYTGVNPKIGLLWQPRRGIEAFVDVTRSQDVPDFTDLVQTQATGATGFVPLRTQSAYTVELGTRGTSGRFGWDATLYRSWLRGEMLQFATSPDIPAATFNAGRTVHQGVELAAHVELFRDIAGPRAGDTLTLSQLWNYSDFSFRHDPQYGDNKIAGTPPHVLRTIVTYAYRNDWSFSPVVDWVPRGAFVDDANTLRAPGYVLIGLQADYQLTDAVLLFLDARNLADQRYVSDFGTVTDARTANTQVFYPGDGRSFYAGLRAAF